MTEQKCVKKYINSKIDTVADYTIRIPDSENFEFLVIFVARIPHFASQSFQIQGKLRRQLNYQQSQINISVSILSGF